MFTGIIESTGIVRGVQVAGTNRTFWIESPLSSGFRIDQSVSHTGACLTVEEILGDRHRVTAIGETLAKTNLANWTTGTVVNLERSLMLNARLDGHFVQGHVDGMGRCVGSHDKDGSREYEIEFPKESAALIIEKGSICLNGVSLTVFNVRKRKFTVAIIPYTLQHTNLHLLREGDIVNLEYDVLGKYIQRRLYLEKNS